MELKTEDDVFRFWQENNIYEKWRARNQGKEKFFFLDGPPYATGSIHIGTAWNKILKDTFIRFWMMRGYDVWNQAGYDTHGLPIENKVEKELGLKNKKDIERFGVSEFIKKCKDFIDRNMKKMNEQFRNLGVWMDFERPYITYHNRYIEGAWYTFKKAYEKGFLYKDKYPVHVCMHCETAVAYNEVEYFKKKSPSIIVKFPVKGKENEYLLIWTTTPWTLPANTGIMVHPYIEYVKVFVKLGDRHEHWIVAKSRLEDVVTKARIEQYDVVEEFDGSELEGLEYESPLAEFVPLQKNLEGGHRVVLSEQYVSDDEGTGLVHSAPGHGKEDYRVGKKEGLPVLSPVGIDGTYDQTVGELSGMNVFDANEVIMQKLEESGHLVYRGTITHDYPKCWRCDTPLIIASIPQWFFAVSTIRDILIAENEKVEWNPKWAKDRFRNWLESLDDWPISRQRYWGIPLPIWECSRCGNVRVIGSADELPSRLEDLHKPYIDDVVLECECGGEMKRVPDVLDVWFDSGVAAWASLDYPSRPEKLERWFPVDMELEGPDQFRGWWNSQFITSVMTFDRKPFNRVLLHGFVLDAHGIKMSKSKGNIVQPEDVIERYSRDVLRAFLMSSPPWEDFYFSWEGVEETSRKLNIIRNIYRFVSTYVNPVDEHEYGDLLLEDRWILSRLSSVTGVAVSEMERMNPHKALDAILRFAIDDFSRTYIKLVRDRVWPSYSGSDRKAAEYTLTIVSRSLASLLAPFVPFLAEQAYQMIGGPEESVHLLEFGRDGFRDRDVEERFEKIREFAEKVTAFRKERGIKLRWPLKHVSAPLEGEDLALFGRMANISTVTTGEFSISDEIDDDEAFFREVSRWIQAKRKEMGLVVDDRVVVETDSKKVIGFSDRLAGEVGAEQVVEGSGEEVDFGRFGKIRISVRKVE